MRVAVNTRHLLRDRLEGVGTVTHEVMKRIVRDHPDDHYDYFFDKRDRTFMFSTHKASVPPQVLAQSSRGEEYQATEG